MGEQETWNQHEEEIVNNRTWRRMFGIGGGVLASLVLATSALGFECMNASKSSQNAGAQVIIGPNDEIEFMTPGVANRIRQGLIDPESGEGFRGLIGIDFDGDGSAEISTWFGVGPDGEVPLTAQFRGPVCRGLTNIGLYLEQCVSS
jgi:hypothetical protein